MKVAIIVEGGIVQNVLSDQEDLELVVVDYDTDGLEEEEITTILHNDAYIYGGVKEPEVNKEEVDRIFQDATK